MPTFSELKTEVTTLLIDAPDAVRSLVGTYVNRAMRTIQTDYNFKVMESEKAFTTTTLTRELGSFVAGDRVKEFRDFPYLRRFDGQVKRLFWLPGREDALLTYSYSTDDLSDKGEPRDLWLVVADDNETRTVEVGPLPDVSQSDWSDGEYRIIIPYYRYLPGLVNDIDENWFTTFGEEALIFMATGFGFMADWDEERATGWFQLATTKIRELKSKEAGASTSKSRVLAPRADVYANRDQWRRS